MTIKRELKQHIYSLIEDGVLNDDNREDWHFHAFNEDYYIIGYYESSKWLKKHNLNAFEAIKMCQEYEIDNFGEDSVSIYDNAEKTVNMLVYIYGEQIINSLPTYYNSEEIKDSL